MDIRLGLAGFGLLVSSGTVTASSLPVLDGHMAGPRTKVLVLGTMHLSGLPKDFKPAALEPLLARLAAYAPDVITIEAIPGTDCDFMARQPAAYPAGDVAHYCHSTAAAKAATGLDVYAAAAEVRKILGGWSRQPAPAQRRHLAALFMAAGDEASAFTQWLQLPQAERHAGDGLDPALVVMLEGFDTAQNEDYQIAARLAARLGLQQVFPVDDHTGDNVQVSDDAAYGKAIQAAWDAAAARVKPVRDREAALEKAGDMLGAYRLINRPDAMQDAVAGDFGAALEDPSPQHYGQLYVAGWETRNLRMVSNVREAFREHPGARVLSIVGASHKPWFDGLLGQMQGVDVLDVEKVLQAPAD